MKRFCRQSFMVLSFALALALIVPLAATGEMIKKADNFVVYVDQSGSMVEGYGTAGQNKFDQAVAAVKGFDKAVPELGYTSAVAFFSPFKLTGAPAVYKNNSLGTAVDGRGLPFSHLTSIGGAFDDVDSVLGKLSGKTALILFTDGESNTGSDPVARAKALYGKYAPNLCVHVVSYATTPHGQKTIDAIRALSGCSVVVEGKSLNSDAAMAQFAKDVLYEERQPAPVAKPAPKPEPKPAPKPAPAPVAKEVITFNLLFGFDKSAITDEMVPVLEQAKMILEEDGGTNFVVSGHTDSTGTEEYNQGLSERRAASVKNWLVSNGVSANRLKVAGYGETRAKYDNGTKEGRKLNRRVELQSQ